MATLLDVFAAPRGERSRTRKLREAFLRGWLKNHPKTSVTSLDLAKDHGKLPVFDEWDVEAKFEVAYGEGKLGDELAARWESLVALTDQLHASDVVLVSCPMWNFSIPWMLKRWIDAVMQPRLTFDVREGAVQGLLKGRRAVVLITRDSSYAPGSPLAAFDYQVPYLKFVLGFMGLDPVDVVVAEPLAAAGPEAGAAALENAILAAEKLGASL